LAEALEFADHAVALAEVLCAADALNAESRALLGRSLVTLARIRSQSGDTAATQSAAERAVQVLEALCMLDPDNWWAAADLAAARRILQ
jgi:hypothetical protein